MLNSLNPTPEGDSIFESSRRLVVKFPTSLKQKHNQEIKKLIHNDLKLKNKNPKLMQKNIQYAIKGFLSLE